jgi:hypothetical protein
MSKDLLKTYPSVKCDTKAYLAQDAYVASNRAVFNKDWTINLEASHHYLYWDSNFRSQDYANKGISFDQRCQQIIAECKNKKILSLLEDENYVICTHFNNGYNFGNWYETIASLRFVETSNFKILANRSKHPGVSEIELHFELAGFTEEQLVYYDKSNFVPFVHNLYCPTIDRWIGTTNCIRKDLPDTQRLWRDQRFDWIRSRYLNHAKVKNVLDNIPRKLYLSRNGLNHGTIGYNRKVINEETEIIPYLLDKGFTIVKGDEPLLTMINYFYSASEIVFPHGSLIHNAIFCSNRPKILEFMSEHRLRDHFYLLFNDLASNYDMAISKADSELTNDITIDINTLRSKL